MACLQGSWLSTCSFIATARLEQPPSKGRGGASGHRVVGLGRPQLSGC